MTSDAVCVFNALFLCRPCQEYIDTLSNIHCTLDPANTEVAERECTVHSHLYLAGVCAVSAELRLTMLLEFWVHESAADLPVASKEYNYRVHTPKAACSTGMSCDVVRCTEWPLIG